MKSYYFLLCVWLILNPFLFSCAQKPAGHENEARTMDNKYANSVPEGTLDEAKTTTDSNSAKNIQDEGRDMIIDFYNHYIFAQDSEHSLTYYCMPALVKEATYEHPEYGEAVDMSCFAGNSPDGPFDGHLIEVTNDGDQWYIVTYSEYGNTHSTRVLITRNKNRFMIKKTIPQALGEQ